MTDEEKLLKMFHIVHGEYSSKCEVSVGVAYAEYDCGV